MEARNVYKGENRRKQVEADRRQAKKSDKKAGIGQSGMIGLQSK
jgi:hypothetical protein